MGNKKYWQELNEEYNCFNLNSTDNEIQKQYEEHSKQEAELLDKFGESAWNIFEFVEEYDLENISASKLRELIRYEMDKCFKKLG